MVTRLGEDVWWVDLRGVNAFIVDDDGTLTLVDAGHPWSTNSIAAAITAVGGTVSEIERVLVTHYDIDHVGALGAFDTLDATIYIGRADAPFLRRERLPSLSNQKELFQRAVDWLRSVPDQPVELLDDGDTVGSFTAYHSPGHTPGHTVFASEHHRAAFLGDLVMESDGTLVPTPWYICRHADQNRAAVRDVEQRLGPFDIAAPGHGTPFTNGGSQQLADCVARLNRQ